MPRGRKRLLANVQQNGYGKCPCGGRYENRWVEIRMTVQGQVVLLEDVSQGACPMCGSRVYKTRVLEQIEALMKSSKESTVGK